MTKLIIANWKNHPENLNEAKELFDFESAEAKKHPNIKVAICPPENFFKEFATTGMSYLGAQDFFWQADEIVPANYVLVGHSDRRKAGDTDEIINQKIKSALAAETTPILLVGERNKGDDRKKVLEDQLAKNLDNLPTYEVGKVLICYEPVWAISRPNPEVDLFKFSQSPKLSAFPNTTILSPDTPENTLEAIEVINNFLLTTYNVQPKAVLYGGSVTRNNVADFLKYPEIGGAVIGGASLRKEEFAEILKIVSQIK